MKVEAIRNMEREAKENQLKQQQELVQVAQAPEPVSRIQQPTLKDPSITSLEHPPPAPHQPEHQEPSEPHTEDDHEESEQSSQDYTYTSKISKQRAHLILRDVSIC